MGGRLRAIIGALAVSLVLPLSAALPAVAATPDPNDFVFDSYDATYELGRDAEGRSTLLTTETLVARFPDFDQNRGLQRDLVRVYDEHPTDLEVLSVTNARGEPRAFVTAASGDFTTVTIAVPEGQYVHGAQTYVLTYVQRDVTQTIAGEDIDEFYWDVNGDGWGQPFARVSARVVLDEDLAGLFSGAAVCYRGGFGSPTQCEIAADARGVSVDEADLGPGETVTVALGFPGRTFQPRPVPFLERVPLLPIGGGVAALAAIIVAIGCRLRNRRGAQTGRAIIAEYEPPQGVTVAVAAALLRAPGKALTATLLELAVRRRIRVLFDEPTGQYGAQLLDDSGLAPSEQALVASVFASGSTQWFDRRSTTLGDAGGRLVRSAMTEVRSRRLIESAPKWPGAVVTGLLVLALLLPVIHSLLTADFLLLAVLVPVGINALVWIGLLLVGLAIVGSRRTHDGALMHDHLMGLREFIRLAEADRIRMLQSASGAEVTSDRIVQLYERLLPYAVLFGMEREWQEVLEPYYLESAPTWAYGSSGAHAFSIGSLSAAVASAPTTRVRSSGGRSSSSSFSSRSSGSSGGGFSGGGGGGGGGRGI